jgi:hypothetical protein
MKVLTKLVCNSIILINRKKVNIMQERMNFSVAATPIVTILNSIKTMKYGGLDLQPKYQRDFIWKDDFKDKLIYSIIKDYPIGNISIRTLNGKEPNTKGAKSEVVDGQQRLTTIKDFAEGTYKIKSEWSRKIICEIQGYLGDMEDEKLLKLSKRMERGNKIKLSFNDLPEIIQGNITAFNISVSSITNTNEDQITEYFGFLQNQERLRAGEIINSMPDTKLEKYIKMIENKANFLNVIGFSDDRREFDKIFYSMIGLSDSKIPLGTTDKQIQKYVSEAEEITVGKEYTLNMIRQINTISKIDSVILKDIKKRYLKYLLMLAGFNLVDFSEDAEIKLKKLSDLDNKFSSFFSAKANISDEMFKEYSYEVREEFRYIALISKGGHSLDRAINRMRILAFHINNINNKNTASNIELIENEK